MTQKRPGESSVIEIAAEETARWCARSRSAGEFGRRFMLGVRRAARESFAGVQGATLGPVRARRRPDNTIATRELLLEFTPSRSPIADPDRVLTSDELQALVDEPVRADPLGMVYVAQRVADAWIALGLDWPSRTVTTQLWPDAWRWQCVLVGRHLSRGMAYAIAPWSGGGKSLDLYEFDDSFMDSWEGEEWYARGVRVTQGPVCWIASRPNGQEGAEWATSAANFIGAAVRKYPGVLWTAVGIRAVRTGDVSIEGRK